MTTAFEREQASEMDRAKACVAELGHALRAAGWDCVVLRVSRVLTDGAGNCASAGANTGRRRPGGDPAKEHVYA
jgi:hypothetical protein